MSRHLWQEIERFQKRLLTESASVEEQVIKAAKAITTRDAALAAEVIAADDAIDGMEVELEEEALKILALHHPVAGDLRLIVASLKINQDLERIGDLAVNIAKRARWLARHERAAPAMDFEPIARKAIAMLRASLDAVVDMDLAKAKAVCAEDDAVDAMNRELVARIKSLLAAEGPRDVEALLQLLAVPRHLERIADHAVSIAEDAVYLVSGRIVRHAHEDEAANGSRP